jgi:hypothetical protein
MLEERRDMLVCRAVTQPLRAVVVEVSIVVVVGVVVLGEEIVVVEGVLMDFACSSRVLMFGGRREVWWGPSRRFRRIVPTP